MKITGLTPFTEASPKVLGKDDGQLHFPRKSLLHPPFILNIRTEVTPSLPLAKRTPFAQPALPQSMALSLTAIKIHIQYEARAIAA